MSTPERTMATTGGMAGSGGVGDGRRGVRVHRRAHLRDGVRRGEGLLEGADALTTTAGELQSQDERQEGAPGVQREPATAIAGAAGAAATGGTAGVIVGAVIGGIWGFLVGMLLGNALGEAKRFWRARGGGP